VGVVRSVRRESVLEKTQLGIEFLSGSEYYQDKILQFVLEENLPPESILKQANHTR